MPNGILTSALRPNSVSRQLIKRVTPRLLLQCFRNLSDRRTSKRCGLFGEYRSWKEACGASTGYEVPIILERTRDALLKVKKGEATYERDSVLFPEIQYAWPLLAGLMWVAAQSEGKINVLDFGGSLGSTYFQNRSFLNVLSEVRWNVVEQVNHVEAGKKWFQDDQLRFYLSVEDCLNETKPNLVILSGVLQYLEHPYRMLRELLELPSKHVIIDRTPFWEGPADKLSVENVHPGIFPASYPSWIFSTPAFHSQLTKGWEIFAAFDTQDKLNGPVRFAYRGMILRRIP